MRKLKLRELGRQDVKSYQLTEKLPIVVVLDNIRSALNVGSIFRTADAMAAEKIILCGITATPPSREITKTAIGATESVTWSYFKDISSALCELKSLDYHIIAIEQTDKSQVLSTYSIPQKKIAIVLGNEVDGVSEEALTLCDEAIEIAQYGTKHSLNVSVCGGIVIHDLASKMRSD